MCATRQTFIKMKSPILVLMLLLIAGPAFVLTSVLSDQEKLAEIGKRLEQHVEQDAKRCYPKGNWGNKYTELHKEQLTSPTGKRLVAVPHLSGMADRVVGFSTALMLAILSNRAFQMGKRGKLPAFEEAFNSPSINWTREHDPDWLIEPLAEKANPRNYNQSVLESKEYYAVNTINDIRLQDSLLRKDVAVIMGGDARTTMFVGNRGKTIRMFENEHYNKRLVEEMGLTPYTLFGCLINFMMQPKKEIFLPVYDQFQQMSDLNSKVLKISIQIRAGDHVWGNNNRGNDAEGKALLASFDRYFACAKQIETFVLADHPDKYTSVLWYLATDSKALRHAAAAHYGEKVITSLHTTLEHSAKESSVCQPNSGEACAVSSNGFTSAAAEWWMLGYADYHVITLYSGYGRTGGYRTLTTDRIYTLHNKPMECTKTSFSDQEKLMYDWSGI